MTALRSLARRPNGSINAKIAGESVQKCVPAPGPCVMSGPCAGTIPRCGRTRPFFAWGRYKRPVAYPLSRMTAAPLRGLQDGSMFHPGREHYSRPRSFACMSNGEMLQAFYFALAFCAAQRLRCASAIFLRASALNTRFFLGLALAGAFLALLPALVVVVPMLASSLRACESLAISESIWARMFSIAIYRG